MLPEITRIDYLKKLVRNRISGDIYYNSNYEETVNYDVEIIENTEPPYIYKIINKLNKCFICDHNLLPNHNCVGIIDNNIIETGRFLDIDVIYPITCRCISCRNGKYGELLVNNSHVIMARNYKWMTFYLGLTDTIPKEILWIIIILYQNIR
jgi:hypothetical protein